MPVDWPGVKLRFYDADHIFFKHKLLLTCKPIDKSTQDVYACRNKCFIMNSIVMIKQNSGFFFASIFNKIKMRF